MQETTSATTNSGSVLPEIRIRSPRETVGPFARALQEIIWRVELGLSAALPQTETSLPSTILRITPAMNLKRTMGERHEDFANWTLVNGLREFAEAFHLFLDDLHITCSWYELATISPVTDEYIHGLIDKPQAEFHGLNLPSKLNQLRKRFAITFSKTDLELLKSLNRARNCLAHRRGIVRAEDTNTGNEVLLVRWRGIRKEFEGKMYELHETLHGRAGQTMDIVACPVERRFKVGERLLFTPGDFVEIGMTYLFAAESVVPKLNALADRCISEA